MLGSSKIGPRIRALVTGRDQVEFTWLLQQTVDNAYTISGAAVTGIKYSAAATVP